MGETPAQTVLARKATTGREARKARAVTLQKALRISMGKAADALMDLPAAVIGAVVQPLDGEGVEAALDENALLLLLDGPGRCTAAVMIDPVVVGALIQQQTIGMVLPDSGDTRPMTRTDAAICAPLIDMLLARAAPILDDMDDRTLIEGFEFGAKADDARTLSLALDASDYVSIKLTVDVARGVRQGDITLILPALNARRDARDDTVTEDGDGPEPPGPDLTKAVMSLNADLDMIVCHLKVPLNALRAMRIGETLALVPGTFPSVQIVTRTGRILGRGVVGHVDGVRAVRPLRAPAHAAQPLRRVSDQPHVDLPTVEVLTSLGRRSTVPREVDVSEDDIEEAMRVLSQNLDKKKGAAPPAQKLPADLPVATSGKAAGKMVDLPDLDDLEDLPDLDSLPDLEDLPDLADMPDLVDLPMQSMG